jgi:hypothetical protein
MAAVSALIFSERLENPAPLGWRWRGFGKASRLIRAQTQQYFYRFHPAFADKSSR